MGDQPWSASRPVGPFTASSKREDVREGSSRNATNSRSLPPSTSVKLSVFHVISVVNRSRVGALSVRHRSVTTGCQVGSHAKPLVGTSHEGVPMLAPKVKRWSKPRKNSTYQGSPFAIASWVNTGSESTKTRRGIRAYSSRQNHEPPDRFTSRSASAQYARSASRESP